MREVLERKNQVRRVEAFRAMVDTPFRGDKNAICWSRNLEGDFAEIVEKVDMAEDIVTLGEEELMDLELSEQGQLARETLLNDLKLLQEYGAAPVLNVIRCYERDDSSLAFPTDVYSYHVDRSPVPTDTILCTYHGAASDILPNDQGVQKILVPELREKLRELYGGEADGFEDFLKENYFDLHYQALPEARPINLGVGHMWRLAIDHPESEVLPCLHRAPLEADGQRRLLMICQQGDDLVLQPALHLRPRLIAKSQTLGDLWQFSLRQYSYKHFEMLKIEV